MPGPTNAIDYYTTHADVYDIQITDLSDLDFYLDLATDPTVEIGAGTGRLAIPIAETGRHVFAIERFAEMLRLARPKVRAAGMAQRIDLIQADMRQFALGVPVPLILLPGQVFMHNLTTEEQLATLQCCFDALAAGGQIVIDVFNPNPQNDR
jgi:precorrin-6B methylase 2